MNKLIASLFLAGIAGLGFADHATPAPAKPNIVVILADDLGYGDVKCRNPLGKIPTPWIDTLATQGMTFTDGHAGAACCTPTRYGLLTGRHCWRTRLKSHTLHEYCPPLIEADRLTLPALLRQQGYHTAAIGKWHLGMWQGNDPHQEITQGPTSRGFDYFFGMDTPSFAPLCFIENTRTLGLPAAAKGSSAKVPGWQPEDILPTLTQKARAYIGERAATKQPFFLYFALTSPHAPVAPAKAWQGKSGLNAEADFIMQTDAVVGEMMDALKQAGIADNTIVIFTADNGHAGSKYLEDLVTKGHHPSGDYRGYKADIWEGGHREPMFIRWPAKIKAASSCADPVCLTDLLATTADLLGVHLPDNTGEDSVSILRDLLGTATAPTHEFLIHQAAGGALAIREGRWKLELCPGSGGYGVTLSVPSDEQARKAGLPPIQLYDMEADPGEKKNLQGEHPEIVVRLRSRLTQAIKSGHSRPNL